MRDRYAKNSKCIRSMWLIFNCLNVGNLDIYKKTISFLSYYFKSSFSVIMLKGKPSTCFSIIYKRKDMRKSKMKLLILREKQQSWI